MDFRFTDEQEKFCSQIREFLKQEPPERWPVQDEDEGYGYGAWSNEFLLRLGQKGWLGLTWPTLWGGGGLSPTYLYLLFNEFASAYAPAEALFFVEQGGGTVNRYGSQELKQEILPQLLRGEATVVEGLSESDAGSDLLSLKTTAVKKGEGYVINGSKMWTSNGHLANYDLLIAKTDPSAPRHRSISAFLVNLGLPGVTSKPIQDMAGAYSFTEVYLDNVYVPERYLIGVENQGFSELLATLEWDRFWGRCMKASFLDRLLSDLVDYCKSTPHGGRMLSSDESVADRLAEFKIEIESLKVLYYKALCAMEEGKLNVEASVAKTFADDVGQRFARGAISLLGSIGQMTGSRSPLGGRITRLLFTSLGHTLAGGTTEIQLTTLANRGLGLPR